MRSTLQTMHSPIPISSKPGPEPIAPTTERDVVCGMSVSADSRHRHVHGGREFKFCSARCKERFAAEPEAFLPGGAPKAEPASMPAPTPTVYTCPMHLEVRRN